MMSAIKLPPPASAPPGLAPAGEPITLLGELMISTPPPKSDALDPLPSWMSFESSSAVRQVPLGVGEAAGAVGADKIAYDHVAGGSILDRHAAGAIGGDQVVRGGRGSADRRVGGPVQEDARAGGVRAGRPVRLTSVFCPVTSVPIKFPWMTLLSGTAVPSDVMGGGDGDAVGDVARDQVAHAGDAGRRGWFRWCRRSCWPRRPSSSTPEPKLPRPDVPARVVPIRVALDRVVCLAASGDLDAVADVARDQVALSRRRCRRSRRWSDRSSRQWPRTVEEGVSTMKIPSMRLDNGSVPVTSVPMKLAWIVIWLAPCPTSWMPLPRLPEIKLPPRLIGPGPPASGLPIVSWGRLRPARRQPSFPAGS